MITTKTVTPVLRGKALSSLTNTNAKNRKLLINAFLTICTLLSLQQAQAQVSGTVFKDFNANGAKDNTTTFNEVGQDGVVVKSGCLIGPSSLTRSPRRPMPSKPMLASEGRGVRHDANHAHW